MCDLSVIKEKILSLDSVFAIIAEKNDQLKKLKEANNKLYNELRNAERVKSDYNLCKAECAQHSETIANANSTIESLKFNLKSLKSEYDSRENEIQDYKKTEARLKKRLSSLKERTSPVKRSTRLSSKQGELLEKCEELEKFKIEKCKEFEEKNSCLRRDKEELKKKNEHLQAENEKLSGDLKELCLLKQENVRLSSKIKQSQVENVRLCEENKVLQGKGLEGIVEFSRNKNVRDVATECPTEFEEVKSVKDVAVECALLRDFDCLQCEVNRNKDNIIFGDQFEIPTSPLRDDCMDVSRILENDLRLESDSDNSDEEENLFSVEEIYSMVYESTNIPELIGPIESRSNSPENEDYENTDQVPVPKKLFKDAEIQTSDSSTFSSSTQTIMENSDKMIQTNYEPTIVHDDKQTQTSISSNWKNGDKIIQTNEEYTIVHGDKQTQTSIINNDKIIQTNEEHRIVNDDKQTQTCISSSMQNSDKIIQTNEEPTIVNDNKQTQTCILSSKKNSDKIIQTIEELTIVNDNKQTQTCISSNKKNSDKIIQTNKEPTIVNDDKQTQTNFSQTDCDLFSTQTQTDNKAKNYSKSKSPKITVKKAVNVLKRSKIDITLKAGRLIRYNKQTAGRTKEQIQRRMERNIMDKIIAYINDSLGLNLNNQLDLRGRFNVRQLESLNSASDSEKSSGNVSLQCKKGFDSGYTSGLDYFNLDGDVQMQTDASSDISGAFVNSLRNRSVVNEATKLGESSKKQIFKNEVDDCSRILNSLKQKTPSLHKNYINNDDCFKLAFETPTKYLQNSNVEHIIVNDDKQTQIGSDIRTNFSSKKQIIKENTVDDFSRILNSLKPKASLDRNNINNGNLLQNNSKVNEASKVVEETRSPESSKKQIIQKKDDDFSRILNSLKLKNPSLYKSDLIENSLQNSNVVNKATKLGESLKKQIFKNEVNDCSRILNSLTQKTPSLHKNDIIKDDLVKISLQNSCVVSNATKVVKLEETSNKQICKNEVDDCSRILNSGLDRNDIKNVANQDNHFQSTSSTKSSINFTKEETISNCVLSKTEILDVKVNEEDSENDDIELDSLLVNDILREMTCHGKISPLPVSETEETPSCVKKKPTKKKSMKRKSSEKIEKGSKKICEDQTTELDKAAKICPICRNELNDNYCTRCYSSEPVFIKLGKVDETQNGLDNLNKKPKQVHETQSIFDNQSIKPKQVHETQSIFDNQFIKPKQVHVNQSGFDNVSIKPKQMHETQSGFDNLSIKVQETQSVDTFSSQVDEDMIYLSNNQDISHLLNEMEGQSTQDEDIHNISMHSSIDSNNEFNIVELSKKHVTPFQQSNQVNINNTYSVPNFKQSGEPTLYNIHNTSKEINATINERISPTVSNRLSNEEGFKNIAKINFANLTYNSHRPKINSVISDKSNINKIIATNNHEPKSNCVSNIKKETAGTIANGAISPTDLSTISNNKNQNNSTNIQKMQNTGASNVKINSTNTSNYSIFDCVANLKQSSESDTNINSTAASVSNEERISPTIISNKEFNMDQNNALLTKNAYSSESMNVRNEAEWDPEIEMKKVKNNGLQYKKSASKVETIIETKDESMELPEIEIDTSNNDTVELISNESREINDDNGTPESVKTVVQSSKAIENDKKSAKKQANAERKKSYIQWDSVKTAFNDVVRFKGVGEYTVTALHAFQTIGKQKLASYFLHEVIEDKCEVQKGLSPFEPFLSITQRTVIGLLLHIENTRHPNIVECFLSICEQQLLFKENYPLDIEKITRIYASICKMRRCKNRLRRLILDGLFFMGDSVLPLIYYTLTVWLQVLKRNDSGEEDIKDSFSKILFQTVMTKNNADLEFCLTSLKNMLRVYYKYPKEKYSENDLIKEFLECYMTTLSKKYAIAILILCKNNKKEWIARQVALLEELVLIVKKKEVLSGLNELLGNLQKLTK